MDDQFRIGEDPKFSGQNSQRIKLTKLLQDSEAFENFFFPPAGSIDYDLNDANLNINLHELQELLKEENNSEGFDDVKGHGSNIVPMQMNNSDAVIETNKHKDEGHSKDYVIRKRYKKGSIEYARMIERRNIKSRETSARYFERQKAYLEQLVLMAKEFSKKNTHLEKLFQFGRNSLSSERTQKQLRRTASASL